jgi:hypothetical protein
MHSYSKTFYDLTEHRPFIREVSVLTGIACGTAIEFFYPPESQDGILSALHGAEISITSLDSDSLTINAEGFFLQDQIEKTLCVLKSAHFISESFVRQISEHFPSPSGGVLPLNEIQEGFSDSSNDRSTMNMSDFFSSDPIPHRSDFHTLAGGNFFIHWVEVRATGLTRQETGRMIDVNAEILINETLPSPTNYEKLADLNIDIPHEYCCPLSLYIMTDPVYIKGDTTGQRFELKWIKKWLTEKETHPSTRVSFKIESLKADLTLKNEIDTFVESSLAAHLGIKNNI